jgi:hypothetical protein
MPCHTLRALACLPLLLGGSGHAANLDGLLVAYDLGDLQALQPVAEALHVRGHRIGLLGLGQAGKELNRSVKKPYGLAFTRTAELGREQRLTASELGSITGAHAPRWCLAGMASAAQAQILNAYGQRAVAMAYYDNVEDPRNKAYIVPFMNEIRLDLLRKLLVPTEFTRRYCVSYLKDSPGVAVELTGNPGFETWSRTFAQTDPARLRARLGIPAGRPVVLFAGGYDPGYPVYFRIFIQGVKGNPGIQVLASPHPKTDGQVERAIVREEGARNVRIQPGAEGGLAALAALSDLVVCHQSSAGFQAWCQNRPVVFVADPGTYANALTEQGLAAIAGTPGAVGRAVAAALAQGRSARPVPPEGVPADATRRMVELLEAVSR